MRKLLFAFVSVLGIALLFGGCQDKNNTIKIGVLIPKTEELGTYGVSVEEGMNIALEEINSNNPKNLQIELDIQDTKADAKEANLILSNMIDIKGINLFIGDISSSVTLSLLKRVEDSKSFLFSPGAASPKLANASNSFARNWPSSNEEASTAASYVFNSLKSQDASIIYVNNDWGLGLQSTFKSKFQSFGGQIVSEEIYEFGQTDFRTIITKIKSSNPNVIYLAGNQKEMGFLTKQLKENGVEAKLISNTSYLENDCLNIAGKYAEGVIVSTPSYNPSDYSSKVSKKFQEKFQSKYGKLPSLVNCNGYDAVMLIHEAIVKSGKNSSNIANYIRNLKDFHGAAGIISFTNGEVERKITIMQIEEGKPVILNQ